MTEKPATPSTSKTLTTARIFQTWWPLALSWLLMAAELPSLSAVIARLPDAEINLAAYGGIVLPLALLIEAPIIMLLAASTALSKDWDSYLKLRRFMMVSGAALTALHILIAVTPLYYVIVRGLIGAPEQIIEPARIGLIIMTPWSWAIAYRRFNQGVLIRFGRARAVGVGTIIRLGADLTVLLGGYLIGTIPGIVVATAAVGTGVTLEALYAGLRVRPVVKNELQQAPAPAAALTFSTFLAFYLPLVMTQLMTMLSEPIGSATISRMPRPIESLAVWPVLTGLNFMLTSGGVAFNEVVVSLLEHPQGVKQLRRFAVWLATGLTAVLLLIAATPLARLWFGEVSALRPELTRMAIIALWLTAPTPALAVLQSWFQGVILESRKTRAITEAIAIFLLVASALMGAGVILKGFEGLYVATLAYSAGLISQVLWLWLRSRRAIYSFEERDAVPSLLEAGTAPIQ